MAKKKAVARKSASSKSIQEERIAALRDALTAYFLGRAATAEHFWNAANPSFGDRSPAKVVKAGNIGAVEQYVNYLRKHARSAKQEFNTTKPMEGSFSVLEGKTQDVLEKMNELPADHHVIVIIFPDPESYYTFAPVCRQIISVLPEIMRRLKRRQNLICARLLYSFTVDLPIMIPKPKSRRSSV